MTRRRRTRRSDRHARRLAMHHCTELRDRHSMPYYERSIPKELRAYATLELLPLLALTGRKIAEQHRLATHCIHNAMLAGTVGACVGDTRNTSQRGVRLRVRVWDALVDAGFVIMRTGSEVSGMQTRYLATPWLLTHIQGWPLGHLVNQQLGRNTKTPTRPSWRLWLCSEPAEMKAESYCRFRPQSSMHP